MPPWVDKESIEEFYIVTRWYTEDTGIEHQVDHIWPLYPKDKSFIGLHVPWNLQVITAKENHQKHSKRPTVL